MRSIKTYLAIVVVAAMGITQQAGAKSWTLNECIDYALANNITLKKNVLQQRSALEDVKQAQAALMPSLSASTSQNVGYTPWPQEGQFVVNGDQVETRSNKASYNGSYGFNTSWTVWNGNQNRNQVKLNKLAAQQAELDSAETANLLKEQIAQLYVQILYSAEAISVNKESLATSQQNEDRGKEMVEVGSLSRADLAQLSAQRAQDEYNIVQAESNLNNYKRQLKQLLQITSAEPFDVEIPNTTDAMALALIPTVADTYAAALESRPEIKNALLGIESSELSKKIAQAGRLPSINLNASAMTNTSTMNSNSFGTQIKNNFNIGAGVSVSIPIFDNRKTKTAINKANIQQLNYELDLQQEQTTLYSDIENYWLQAVNNQNQFKSAQTATNSAQMSYDLLSEQFRLGLKNIVELMTGKDNLLTAKQNELQSKYLAILNIQMLKFYGSGNLDM